MSDFDLVSYKYAHLWDFADGNFAILHQFHTLLFAATQITQLKARLIAMKPSGLPASDGSERRRQPPSNESNHAEATNFSNEGESSRATDGDIGQEDAQGDDAVDLALAGLTNFATDNSDIAQGDDAVDLALAGLTNFATDNSDMESIASTYLHRAIMNAEQRQPPRQTREGETLQESEARRRRVLDILERALEISKETMEDEDDTQQDPHHSSSYD